MGLMQKYREEAQAIANDIHSKYGIICRVCESSSEMNNHIDKIVRELDTLTYNSYNSSNDEFSKNEFLDMGIIRIAYKDIGAYFWLEKRDDIKRELEKFREVANKVHNVTVDKSITFGANNL